MPRSRPDIQPVVRLTGSVGSRPVSATFAPALPITIGPTAVELDVAAAPPLPGATYIPESQSAVLAVALNPVGRVSSLV